MLKHSMADYQDQLELENKSVLEGVERYRATIRKGGVDSSQAAHGLMARVIPAFAKAIEEWVDQSIAGRANRQAIHVRFLQEFEGDYESIAFVVCQVAISAAKQGYPLTSASNEVAKRLEAELEYRHLKLEAPGLYHKLMEQLKYTTHEEHRRKVVVHTKNKCNIERPKWTKATGISLGAKLLGMLSDNNLIISITCTRQRSKSKYMIHTTDETDRWLRETNARCEILEPVYMPMLVPPRPWEGVTGGGYINQSYPNVALIKTRNKAYLEELSHTVMPEVYEAVNTLQETPWTVNNAVLRVMSTVWEEGGSLGKLPARENMPFPAKPHDIATNEEARVAWRMEAAQIRAGNMRLKSKRIAVAAQLHMAEKFKEREAIYYVWTLDWRGRAYPLASFMHPQADDSGKALLQFAEGKKLGPNGGYWLAVHIAGLFGVDKCSFDERVQWVQDNEEAILDSASSPLDGQRFWSTADKPWCALAACYEWMGYCLSGDDYVSRLPVSMDGSCNGLQNFSAVLRDEVGGAAVNLIPTEQPQDIYNEVARVVEERLPATSGWKGNVTRQIVKRPVMTLPYGASRFGMRQQILEEVTKLDSLSGTNMFNSDKERYDQCGYLAGIVYEAIGDVVIAARKAMDWLQDVARVAAKEGLPIHWHTPMGFPVLQNYYMSDAKLVKIAMGIKSIRLKLTEENLKINKKRMAQGIAPNVVHSWDAAHMMRTVLMAKDNGVTAFSMVHDSYGTHAADVDTMSTALREAFIEQYTPDLLEEFMKEILEQIPEALHEKMPPLPSKGQLDIEAVRESEFFFA